MNCEEQRINNITFPETPHQGIIVSDNHVGRCIDGYLDTYPINNLINKCPESTDEYGNTWQESYGGPHFKFNKEDGVIYIRECDNGKWSPVKIENSTLDDTCPQDGIWPITPLNAYTIQENSSDVMIRQCNGERGSPKWGDPYTIKSLYCEANDYLPKTKVGTFANDGDSYTYCGTNGWNDRIQIFYKMANYAPTYNYNSIYKDIVEGVVVDNTDANGFSDVVVYKTDDPPRQIRTILDSYCPADGEWPSAYSHIVKKCPSGNGVMFRACDNGKWSKVNSLECNNTVNNVEKCNAEVIDGIECPETSLGTVTFKNNKLCYCNINKKLDIIDPNNLIQNRCPSNVDSIYNIEWPSTYNFMSIINHNNNRYVRLCNNGTWDDEVYEYNSFVPQLGGTCPQDGKWSETPHYYYSILEDSSNFLIRFCNPPGKWSDSVSFSVSITCPADDEWTRTEVNKTAELTCPDGYSGKKTRLCKADGTWDTINDSCVEESSSWWIWILLIVIVLIFAIVAYFVFMKKDNNSNGNVSVNNK